MLKLKVNNREQIIIIVTIAKKTRYKSIKTSTKNIFNSYNHHHSNYMFFGIDIKSNILYIETPLYF